MNVLPSLKFRINFTVKSPIYGNIYTLRKNYITHYIQDSLEDEDFNFNFFNPTDKVIDTVIVELEDIQLFVRIHYERNIRKNCIKLNRIKNFI